MPVANDSIDVTPGTGATVATTLTGGKEYQVVMQADETGTIIGSRDGFLAFFTANTNAGGRIVGDLFNAGTALVRVQGVWLIPTDTAITGAQIAWDLCRTTAVGVSTTTITPRGLDTGQAALPAGITARASTTGGATVTYTYFTIYSFNEETNAGSILLPYQNQLPIFGNKTVEIVLRQNEGFSMKQVVTMTTGLTGMLCYFVVE